MIVLDSCVLIAFADPADGFHEDAKRILTTADNLAISALGGAEIMVHASSAQRESWLRMLRAFSIEVVSLTADDMSAIARTRQETGLKMPDALVIWLADTRHGTVASFDQRLLAAAQQRGLAVIR